MKEDHNHAVPLIGGPLCGEIVTSEGCTLLKSVPFYYDGKFYTYTLRVLELEHSYNICYEFANEVNQPTKRSIDDTETE